MPYSSISLITVMSGTPSFGEAPGDRAITVHVLTVNMNYTLYVNYFELRPSFRMQIADQIKLANYAINSPSATSLGRSSREVMTADELAVK